jgi:hypothetical protein
LVQVIHAAAAVVVGAIVLLAVSGLAFFAVGAEPSPKFWAKMVVVGVACLNGLVAHRLVFPLVEAGAAGGSGRLDLRPWAARFASASAAVSAASWYGALVLGAWHGLALSFWRILAIYACVLVGAVSFASIVVAPRVFPLAQADSGGDRAHGRRGPRTLAARAGLNLALVIADRATAVAGRLADRSGRSEVRCGGSATDRAYGTWPDRPRRPTGRTWGQDEWARPTAEQSAPSISSRGR